MQCGIGDLGGGIEILPVQDRPLEIGGKPLKHLRQRPKVTSQRQPPQRLVTDFTLDVVQPECQRVQGFGRVGIHQCESEASPVPHFPAPVTGQGDEGLDDRAATGRVTFNAARQSLGKGAPDPGVRVVKSDLVKDELDSLGVVSGPTRRQPL